jgi:multiple sugar transport system substrate-binding protein
MKNLELHRGKSLQKFWVIPMIGPCLALWVSAIGLVGCIAPPVTLRVAVPTDEVLYWEPLISKFKDKTGIQISIDDRAKTTNEVEAYYTTELSQHRTTIDLVYMDAIWVSQFAEKKWLRDLSKDFSAAELSEFLEGDVNAGRYLGKLYRHPFRTTGGVLYYRKDLLKQAGYTKPPTTFEQLFTMSKALSKKSTKPQWGYLWQGQREGMVAMFVEVLQGFGGYWVKNGTEVGLDQPEAIAVKFLRNTILQGISPPDFRSFGETETRDRFLQGNAAFMRNWAEVLAQVNSNEISVNSQVLNNIGITQMPVQKTSNQSGACQGSWGLGISNFSQHPEEALKAIKFLTSELSQRKFALNYYLPSRTSVFNDPQIVDQHPHYPKLLKVMKQAVARPTIAQYKDVSEILQRHLEVALDGKRDPETEMIYAANETRDLLRKVRLDE